MNTVNKVPCYNSITGFNGVAHGLRILWNILDWGHLLMFVSGSVWDPQALSRSQWHSSHQALPVECVWSGPPCRCSCSFEEGGGQFEGVRSQQSSTVYCVALAVFPLFRSCISSLLFGMWTPSSQSLWGGLPHSAQHFVLFCLAFFHLRHFVEWGQCKMAVWTPIE